MHDNVYTPECWKLVKIVSEKYGTIYKVLCSWYGGFTNGDSWKLSSGITSVTRDGGYIIMPQTSGSTYQLHENGEFINSIMGNVFESFAKDARETGKFTIEFVSLEEVTEVFKNDMHSD